MERRRVEKEEEDAREKEEEDTREKEEEEQRAWRERVRQARQLMRVDRESQCKLLSVVQNGASAC